MYPDVPPHKIKEQSEWCPTASGGTSSQAKILSSVQQLKSITKANMREHLGKLPLCNWSVLHSYIVSLPLLRPTQPSVLLYQASPVNSFTLVKTHWARGITSELERGGGGGGVDGERKRISDMMQQKLKAWISSAQQKGGGAQRGFKKKN